MIGAALARAVMKAVKTIKATIMKAMIGVVLAHRQGAIALCSKKIRHGNRILDSFWAATHATLLRIDPGEQAGPGRKALGGVVHVREAKAILRQSVEMRCIHLAAVATDVGEAHIVHKDEYYIGALFRERSR